MSAVVVGDLLLQGWVGEALAVGVEGRVPATTMIYWRGGLDAFQGLRLGIVGHVVALDV